ncbi:MAG: RluA family pseudouridine synthase [Bacillota bacterium]|nr:RluA family pseudouridine synthase [Bacillota bacterium]
MKEIVIEVNDASQRLDRFLKKYLCNLPLSAVYKCIRKDVKVNGKRSKEEYMLKEGDVLSLYVSDADFDAWTKKKEHKKAKRQFQVAYEDDEMLIVSKPFGLLVHGDKTEKKDTLANQVVDYLIENGSYNPRVEKTFTPSPVHRLDRNTTGLVVFGKTAEALRELSKKFREEHESSVRKYYYTIVHGNVDKEYHLKNKLLKDEARNKGIVLKEDDERGKYIETKVRPIYATDRYSLVEVELITGRSHQIRAHLASIKHPLVGDTKYGGKEIKSKQGTWELGRTTQALHAGRLVIDGKEFTAPLPVAWRSMQEELFGKEII